MKEYHQILTDEHQTIIETMSLDASTKPQNIIVPFGVNGRLRNEMRRRSIEIVKTFDAPANSNLETAKNVFSDILNINDVPKWANIQAYCDEKQAIDMAHKMIELGEYNPALFTISNMSPYEIQQAIADATIRFAMARDENE